MAAMLLAVGIPVVAVLSRSFIPTVGLEMAGGSPWGRILGAGRTWRIIGITVAQAFGSTAATVLIGVPIAYVLTRFSFTGRGLLRTAVTVPFVLPSVVLGAAFSAVAGSRGLFDARGSWALIIAAHVCFNLAVVIRSVGSAFGRSGGDSEAAARMLGRTRSGAFFSVALPQVIPAVLASAVIVFLFCLTSFGIVVMLGGGSVTTIEVEIWTRATRQFDLGGAAVLGMVQFLAVLATLGLDSVLGGRNRPVRQGEVAPSRLPSGVGERLAIALSSLAIIMIAIVPLGALVLRSLQIPGGIGLDNWTSMGSVLAGTGMGTTPVHAIANSLSTAAVVTALTVLLAVPTSRYLAGLPGQRAKSLVLAPLGVSATTMGLGLLIAFGSGPFDIRGSGWLVPIAQLLVALPLVTRVLVAPVESIDPSVLDAASLLGADPRNRFWRVELPTLLPALVAGAGLGFVVCLGEFGATVFVARSGSVTMPVLLQQLMSRPGGAGYGQAMALAVVMVLFCGAVLAVTDRLGGRFTGDLTIA
ncbi:MAG: iron ABC transporter permease [Microthrixaceae bacterium]|nr:iron ABC transporter permease [Microthrixaceae bacterium]